MDQWNWDYSVVHGNHIDDSPPSDVPQTTQGYANHLLRMGTSLKSISACPDLNVTVVELVGETYDTFTYFHPGSEDVLTAKNVDLIISDGRNYLLFESKKYDVITVDPSPPIYSAGTVNLYTREFFQLYRSHLKPEGVMCLWVPGDTDDELPAITKTFATEFPYVSMWNGPKHWGVYLVGANKKPSADLFRQNVQKAFANKTIVKDLAEYDKLCIKPEQLYQLFLCNNDTVRKFAMQGELITDNKPYTEFFFLRRLFGNERRLQVFPRDMNLSL